VYAARTDGHSDRKQAPASNVT